MELWNLERKPVITDIFSYGQSAVRQQLKSRFKFYKVMPTALNKALYAERQMVCR